MFFVLILLDLELSEGRTEYIVRAQPRLPEATKCQPQPGHMQMSVPRNAGGLDWELRIFNHRVLL